MHKVTVQSILSPGNGINLCRGCLHGCIYCDARSRCYQMDHDFEDIALKENALELLEKALKAKRSRCIIGTGAMSDPYLPCTESLALTRGTLQLIERYGFGVTLQTKSAGVLRDLDLLQAINQKTRAVVQMTLTTMDDDLCRLLEPRVSPTSQRLETLQILKDHGIPTVVWLCPVLPFLTDTEENISGIVSACRNAGVTGIIQFGMGMTLREGNREYFYAQLDRHFPGLKQRYIRSYGSRYECLSPRHQELSALFHRNCEEAGILHNNDAIFRNLRRFEERASPEQLGFF